MQTASEGNATYDTRRDAGGEWHPPRSREMLTVRETKSSRYKEEIPMHDLIIAMSFMVMVLAPCVVGFAVLPGELSE